ncbi:TolC family protein [Rariglobus hedericola]|uniref:TolC family protein n=1 Tax=Rariglobus hedericola TaxID=2597822 RepID=UPI0013967E97|nr:TolC family protein [Rariglobus hedericola]
MSAQQLSLADALRRADEQNPSLHAQDSTRRAAEALIEQAGVRPNPTLDVTAENFAGTGALRGVDSIETTVQASQTFERGGKRAKRLSVARREREVADHEFTVRRAEVLASTVAAYIDVLAAQERLALSTASLDLARETTDAVAARVKAAVASTAESARARAALATARADHARAESTLTQARAALATIWGGTATDVTTLAGTLRMPDELPAAETLLAKLTTHPRFALQQATISSHRASLQLAQSKNAQDITVGGGVRFLRENSDAGLVAGVSIPLPFRSQNQGNIRAARETLAGAEQATRVIDAALRASFSAAWQDLQISRSIARDLRTDALPATEEALALVRHAYAQGELPLLGVLEAQRAHTVLRREILDAETASASALVRVEALTDPAFPLTTALLSSR